MQSFFSSLFVTVFWIASAVSFVVFDTLSMLQGRPGRRLDLLDLIVESGFFVFMVVVGAIYVRARTKEIVFLKTKDDRLGLPAKAKAISSLVFSVFVPTFFGFGFTSILVMSGVLSFDLPFFTSADSVSDVFLFWVDQTLKGVAFDIFDVWEVPISTLSVNQANIAAKVVVILFRLFVSLIMLNAILTVLGFRVTRQSAN